MKKLALILLLLLGSFSGFSQCLGIAPDPIVIDSVSVDSLGNVIISWQPSNSTNIAPPNVATYTIRRFNPGGGGFQDVIINIPIDSTTFTIPKNFMTVGGFIAAQTDIEVNQYAVYVTDTCMISSITADTDFHNTMLLESTTDVCANTISLTWNPYDDFGSITEYTIFTREDTTGAFTNVGTTLDTNFTFSNVNQGSIYEFFIQATENNGLGPFTASSNRDTVTDSFLTLPQFNYVYTATVVDSQQVNVRFFVDTNASTQRYIIKRALDSNDVFTSIGTLTPTASPQQAFRLFVDTDPDLNTQENPYYYRVDVIDSCGILKTPENVNFAKTILLNVVHSNLEAINVLTWDTYQGWIGEVDNYEIYRSVGGIWDAFPIASIDADSARLYVDDITKITQGNGEFCYRIVANEKAALRVGGLPEATSSSNVACVLHESIIFIPNAFDPFSQFNPSFKPVLTYADPFAYELIIFNRYGQEIFKSNDINVGWRGQTQGSRLVVSAGVYAYQIRFQSAFGEQFERVGHVTLLH